MLTRCPQCATTFRVTPEQLKARQGRVRCGECQEVFNALDTLVEEIPPATAAEPVPAAETPPPPAGAQKSAAAEPTAAPELPSIETALEPSCVEAATPLETEPVTELISVPPAPAEVEAEPVPVLEPLLHEDGPRRDWPWALGIGAALAVLAVQATMHFRTELAVLYPQAKPWLAAACDAFGCELLLPRKPELIGIETSDLHPDADGKLTLLATLKNRAPFAQEYPHLELTLTDTTDRPLVRRILPPAAYLPPQATVSRGFGTNSEVAVNLAVDATGVPAVGYRLYLFYP